MKRIFLILLFVRPLTSLALPAFTYDPESYWCTRIEERNYCLPSGIDAIAVSGHTVVFGIKDKGFSSRERVIFMGGSIASYVEDVLSVNPRAFVPFDSEKIGGWEVLSYEMLGEEGGFAWFIQLEQDSFVEITAESMEAGRSVVEYFLTCRNCLY